MKQLLTVEATQITSNSWGFLPLEKIYDLSTYVHCMYLLGSYFFPAEGSPCGGTIYKKKAHNQINESLWADAIILINDKKCMIYKHLK